MDSGSAGAIGDPDDDHPNAVGDAVLRGLRSVLGKLGSVGDRIAAVLPRKS